MVFQKHFRGFKGGLKSIFRYSSGRFQVAVRGIFQDFQRTSGELQMEFGKVSEEVQQDFGRNLGEFKAELWRN